MLTTSNKGTVKSEFGLPQDDPISSLTGKLWANKYGILILWYSNDHLQYLNDNKQAMIPNAWGYQLLPISKVTSSVVMWPEISHHGICRHHLPMLGHQHFIKTINLRYISPKLNGLVQERCNSIANALELRLSSIKMSQAMGFVLLSIWHDTKCLKTSNFLIFRHFKAYPFWCWGWNVAAATTKIWNKIKWH